MSKEEDRLFVRNFSIIVVLLAVMMVLFLVAARTLGSNKPSQEQIQQREAVVAERTRPVGDVALLGEEPEATDQPADSAAETAMAGELDGKQIYDQLCVACHGIEGIGAPVMGNVESWAPRIAQGMDMLYQNAINGYVGPEGYMMPARGGGNFSDAEVQAAVDYMVSQSQ